MDLKLEIVRLKPREKAGAHTGSMYSFQKNWGICKLLELHQTGQDYAIAFEYHDDILVFDSAIDPKEVSFFQVKGKTTEGKWTITKFLERNPPTSHSIIGKMYINKANFKDAVKSINFVSNASYSFHFQSELKARECDNADCCMLHKDILEKIYNTLLAEHGVNSDEEFVKKTFFISANIDIRNQDDIPKVRLMETIANQFPGMSYKIPPIYKLVLDEIRRKSDNTNDFADFETLIKKKAISRADFDEMLNTMMREISDDQKKCDDIIGRLNGTENASLDVVQIFTRNYRQVLIEIKKEDVTFMKLRKDIRTIIDDMPVTPTLLGRINYVYPKIEVVYPRLYSADFIKTLILFMAYS